MVTLGFCVTRHLQLLPSGQGRRSHGSSGGMTRLLPALASPQRNSALNPTRRTTRQPGLPAWAVTVPSADEPQRRASGRGAAPHPLERKGPSCPGPQQCEAARPEAAERGQERTRGRRRDRLGPAEEEEEEEGAERQTGGGKQRGDPVLVLTPTGPSPGRLPGANSMISAT